jgi:Holliday junction resolvase RusA-like endonuclease
MIENSVERFREKTPLECVVQAFYPIPKSANKKLKSKMQKNEIFPTKKPDSDNVLKIILDALNGVCFEDDSQICDIIFSKRYSINPKIAVKIREVSI